eukprot:6203159-Pleurochrysis_carterae.AAC.1
MNAWGKASTSGRMVKLERTDDCKIGGGTSEVVRVWLSTREAEEGCKRANCACALYEKRREKAPACSKCARERAHDETARTDARRSSRTTGTVHEETESRMRANGASSSACGRGYANGAHVSRIGANDEVARDEWGVRTLQRGRARAAAGATPRPANSHA